MTFLYVLKYYTYDDPGARMGSPSNRVGVALAMSRGNAPFCGISMGSSLLVRGSGVNFIRKGNIVLKKNFQVRGAAFSDGSRA